MAPATMTNSSFPAPTTMTDGWTDFFNTVGTAAGPLLTLFGEQATKQFLSMSMGWADNILLAMGPIGIITIAVSAIRIGGLRLLKAVIGRSRDSRASAEQEFLSSTSEEVCELWSGREVVRLIDKPNHIKYLVVGGGSLPAVERVQFLDAHKAYQQGLLIIQPKPPQYMSEEMLKKILLQTRTSL
ncbi:hypothetical protein EPUS_01540 [Endocarpon pusillum Z07020]|uniref:Uncharacterized protein n=1 Tax=Endocarpon pusillum (strain Z07020 / HMAS-L-300199) TaxID=1263415 RepID=U1HY04_ENDPU|nr:uncharacterized protein EPUS_01540 [Endocarpon pusillum Z07020]ERF75710.1 hypothetical protein EPUS_01540 [Endocarpon pusillum Z07020]